MILLLDNYDSFTYNLLDYLTTAGADCQVVRNDALSVESIRRMTLSGIVLSPGPGRPESAGIMMDLINTYVDSLPILGICLGHQALGVHYGARLVKGEPVHGKTSLAVHTDHLLFKNVPNPFEVMRYHSLIIRELTDTGLLPIAHSEDNSVMAIAHKKSRAIGIQFHPESILTPHGRQLIENWLNWI